MIGSIQKWKTRRAAKQDAAADVDLTEERLTAALGPRPELDTENVFVRGAEEDARPDLIEELREDVRRGEDEMAHHTSPFGLTVLLIFLYVAETIGCCLLMGSMGYENPERVVLGSLLACFLFGIMYVTWKLGSGKRSKWFLIAVLALGAVALAVTVLRVEERESGDDSSPVGDIAAGVVTLALTVGAAFLAEHVLEMRGPAINARKELGKARRRLRRVERRRWFARAHRDSVGRRQIRWDEDASQLRSIYRAEWHVKRARSGLAGRDHRLLENKFE